MEKDANTLLLTRPQNPSNANLHGGQESQPAVTPSQSQQPRRQPKRFVKNQIPDSITNDPALNAAIALLPSNYNFEIHKCVWRVRSTGAKRVALQFPEGLLMYSLVISDILTAFAAVDRCFLLGDVTYGACCVDDLSALALGADLLIHYGHSCLVPVDSTVIPCLYVFVEIKIDVNRLIDTVKLNLKSTITKNLILAGTIQFAAAIRAAKSDLEASGFRVLVPQSKPLSAGEVLGCTAPTIPMSCLADGDDEVVLVFVADGRFHLEAFMIANPKIKAFRYDPYIGSLFLEEYDHKGMKESRRNAIEKAREAKNWGIVLGTLGRQGNPRILDRLEKKMREKGLDWTVILMSEISSTRVSLFGDSVDAWIQIACPRLSIDWGDAFHKPLLTPFEAEIALGDIPGWWERKSGEKMNLKCNEGLDGEKNESSLNDDLNSKCNVGLGCRKKESSCCAHNNDGVKVEGENDELVDYPMDTHKMEENGILVTQRTSLLGLCEENDELVDYPMDYYAQDGGEWNSCYSKNNSSRPVRRK